jgi:DNA-binding PadR family transcriptional regulator
MIALSRRRHVPFLRLLALPLILRFAGFGGPRGGPRRGGGFGPWGFGPPHRRRFERGDLKYVILDLLQERPRHGYDIIRALEERFHGLYSPSPGSVYPTLQLLEDQGLVTSSELDGKRVYTITDEGRVFLKERAETVEDVRSRMDKGWKASPELHSLLHEVRQLGQTVFAQGAHGGLNDPEKVRRLRDLVHRMRTEVEAIFRGESDSPDVV